MRAALETILAGRNHLSSQNSQLWNHVRKLRHKYSLASNDVKRLRTERVQSRAKLETLMKGKEVSKDKSLNASTSASSGPGSSSDEANHDASNDVSMKPSESSSSLTARPTRHHPEGTPGGHFVPEIHIAILFRLFFHVAKTLERSPLRDIQEPEDPPHNYLWPNEP